MLARTTVLVAIDGKIAEAFSLTDHVKPEAATMISYLKSMHITSIIVTGDNWATATAVAREVGIDKVFAETDPVGKANKIKELQMGGMAVAMVGDGINDSPALAASDVESVEGAVKTVVGLVYHKFHGVPVDLLKFVDRKADVDGDGSIDYIEFITATMHKYKLEAEENLYKAFQYFDKDNSG